MGRLWLVLLRPAFAYNYSRDAYVLRAIGRRFGPVLRIDRRVNHEAPADGAYMRGSDGRRSASQARLA